MRLYSIGALMKVLFGLGVLRIIYHHIQVYQQPIIGLSLGFLGVFLTVWGASYFFFLTCYKLFSSRFELRQNSESYTHSLLLAVWTMIQLSLMVTNHWSYGIAIVTLAIFGALHVGIVYETTK